MSYVDCGECPLISTGCRDKCMKADQPHQSEDGTLKPIASNQWSCDKPDEWTAAIDAAHPLRTKNFDAYDKAMAMVGNRKSKSALVDLVCWLLQRAGPVGVGAAQGATLGMRPEVELLQPDDMAALRRFYECCEDSQPYDVPKDRMKRLAELGAVQWCGGARYSLTSFGSMALGSEFATAPLLTHSDHDAKSRDEFNKAHGLSLGVADDSAAARPALKEHP